MLNDFIFTGSAYLMFICSATVWSYNSIVWIVIMNSPQSYGYCSALWCLQPACLSASTPTLLMIMYSPLHADPCLLQSAADKVLLVELLPFPLWDFKKGHSRAGKEWGICLWWCVLMPNGIQFLELEVPIPIRIVKQGLFIFLNDFLNVILWLRSNWRK